jgi:hypothetical protein
MKIKVKSFLLVLCLVLSVGFAQAQACKPVTFNNIPSGTFECMKNHLNDYGIHVPPGNIGELSGHGITAHFVWDGESKLTIQITEKPRFISCGTADNEIGKFVDECQT